MRKSTPEPSLREREIAYRTAEAKKLNLHPKAAEMARTRLGIPMPVVQIYSQLENALDLTQDDVLRDEAIRLAFQDVVYYIRYDTLPSKHEPIPAHTEDYAAEEAHSSREDASEAA